MRVVKGLVTQDLHTFFLEHDRYIKKRKNPETESFTIWITHHNQSTTTDYLRKRRSKTPTHVRWARSMVPLVKD
jgi:hypothetical protein